MKKQVICLFFMFLDKTLHSFATYYIPSFRFSLGPFLFISAFISVFVSAFVSVFVAFFCFCFFISVLFLPLFLSFFPALLPECFFGLNYSLLFRTFKSGKYWIDLARTRASFWSSRSFSLPSVKIHSCYLLPYLIPDASCILKEDLECKCMWLPMHIIGSIKVRFFAAICIFPIRSTVKYPQLAAVAFKVRTRAFSPWKDTSGRPTDL